MHHFSPSAPSQMTCLLSFFSLHLLGSAQRSLGWTSKDNRRIC